MARVKDKNKLHAIHEAALHLVVKTGFTSLKMAEVAREAGIATGTLYIYYPSKEDLVNMLYRNIKSEMVELFDAIVIDENNYKLTFREIWMRYFRFCMENPDKMLFVEQFHYSGIIEDEIIKSTNKAMAKIEDFLAYGQQSGWIVKGGLHLQKAFLHGAIHEWVKSFVAKRVKPGEETVENCFNMTWNGLHVAHL
ncbi:MAG: TetR family transcriptional regulator [Bacteroidetes bacterium]|nr:TetR family transcriptional regulator [Bacteroidota bacterium]